MNIKTVFVKLYYWIKSSVYSKSKDKVKLLICPGYIFSKNDNDRHFITVSMLMKLYRINPHNYEIRIFNPRDTIKYDESWIRIAPLYDGKYEEQIKRLKLEDEDEK